MKSSTAAAPLSAANESESSADLSPLSREVVIGVVGYAGAGCSAAAKRLQILLHSKGYTVHLIKLSDLICAQSAGEEIPTVTAGPDEGAARLARASKLQDLGDKLRGQHGTFAVAALGVRKIKELRGQHIAGQERLAFIIDSIKHREEVEFLRRVYDLSFRLVAVHCERPTREARLVGDLLSTAKYRGAGKSKIIPFIERDEKDQDNPNGQQVREAFYLADYFIDNNKEALEGANLTADLDRFASLLLGTAMVRPTPGERAIYHAHAAALQSACLSRQVGAALVSKAGEIVATGTNDAPRFGGGVYDEESTPDNRCHMWDWQDGDLRFKGCHNDRKKGQLRETIGVWMADNLADDLAEIAHPKTMGMDTAEKARQDTATRFRSHFSSGSSKVSGLPGIKDLIEYSRAIHAEMGAVLSAARSGISPVGATLYCTTYPCHNCARHLVTAGIERVYYVEPYVKSLASELHSDAITNELPPKAVAPTKMVIVPFTGVGPRMYEDFFSKRGDLKGAGGKYIEPAFGVPNHAVRLREMIAVEESAATLIPVPNHG